VKSWVSELAYGFPIRTTQRLKDNETGLYCGEVDVSDADNKDPGPHPEVDLLDILRERFSTGQGFIQLHSDMTNDMMLVVIKQAISLSNGKVFTVIAPSRQHFSNAQGLQGSIQLYPGMTDEEMLFVVKQAISLGKGKAFTVAPPSKINENGDTKV
jgi:hypothetical protein